jgi:3-methyladenine DNA glycosylase AlkC
VSGVAAREFIREADDVNYIHRMVIVGNRTISVSVFGERSIHGNPTVRRFLDSLTLLRGGR